MIDWKIEDKVVCVDNSQTGDILILDKIYTLTNIYPTKFGLMVGLKELSQHLQNGWYASRFRPLIDKKKTTEFFEKLCLDATKKMELVE